MAKSSGIGDILTLGIVGAGVWWFGSANNWWGLFGGAAAATYPTSPGAPTTIGSTAPTVTAPAASTTPAATTISLASPVTATINNALQAAVQIQPAGGSSGQVITMAVIPGGDAYDTSGHGITAQLIALGTTPAAVYALMQAAYTIQQATAPASTTPPSTTTSTTTSTGGPSLPITKLPIMHGPSHVVRPVSGLKGMGGPMVYATQKNYVRRGSSY